MKSILNVTLVVLFATSLFANEVVPPLDEKGEAFESRKDFYFQKKQDTREGLFFSADGQKIVDVLYDEVHIVGVKERRVLSVIKVEGSIDGSILSQNGRYLLLKTLKNYGHLALELIDLEKGTHKVFDENWSSAECDMPSDLRYDMSHDGKYLVFHGKSESSNSIKIWNIEEEKTRTFSLPEEATVSNMLVNSKKEMIAIASEEGEIDVWSLKGEHLHHFKVKKSEEEEYVGSLELSDGGRYLLHDGTLIDLESNKTVVYPNYEEGVTLSFTPDAKELIVHRDMNSTLEFWNIKNQRVENRVDYNDLIASVLVTNNRLYLQAVFYDEEGDESIKVMDLKSKKILNTFYASQIAISPDGHYVTMIKGDDSLVVEELNSSTVIDSVVLKEIDGLSSALLTRDGKILFTLNKKGRVLMWDRENSLALNRLTEVDDVEDFFLTANDKYLILKNDEGTKVWDIAHKKLIESDFNLRIDTESTQIRNLNNSKELLSIGKNGLEIYSIDDMSKPLKEFIRRNDGSWVVFDYVTKKLYRGGEASFPSRIKQSKLGVRLIPFDKK